MTENGKNTESPPEKSLQEQVEEKKAPTRQLFGTFGGVFTPTLLTILGVYHVPAPRLGRGQRRPFGRLAHHSPILCHHHLYRAVHVVGHHEYPYRGWGRFKVYT
jgi:hypothetical protein